MLDLGFDVGRHAIYVASLCFETWAFDDSATEVNLARERAEEAGVSIDFKVGVMTDLPYDDRTFDFVLSFNVIYHGDRDTVAKAISEIRRVLCPAGAGHYDELKILRYAITSLCPMGSDVRQDIDRVGPAVPLTDQTLSSGQRVPSRGSI